MTPPEVRSGVPKSMESGAKQASQGRSPQKAILDPAPSVGPDRWNPVQNRGYEVVPKEPSWPRDTFGQKLAVGGLARRLGTWGSRILGILGWSGSPGINRMLGDPGRFWDLGDPEIWGILG